MVWMFIHSCKWFNRRENKRFISKSWVDPKTLEAIYLSFIRPKLEYASPFIVWPLNSGSTKLENYQIKTAQIVTGGKRRTSHIKLYNEVSWPKVEERRRFNNLNLMHKITHEYSWTWIYLFELSPNKVNSSTWTTSAIKIISNSTSVKQKNIEILFFLIQ